MKLLSFLPAPSFPFIGIAAAAAFAAGALLSYKLVSDHYEAKEAEALSKVIEEMQGQIKRGNEIAAKTEEKLGNIRIINRTINNEVHREVTEKVIYRDCVIPPSGLQLWNAANSGATVPAGKLDAVVPPAAGSEGGKSRGTVAEPRRSGGALP